MLSKIISFFILAAFFCGLSYADTITTNDGREVKGVVVEDYKDRLVFSTPDGEITIPKANIKELALDSEEENLIKLAERAFERRDYNRSYTYYLIAHELNPDSKPAKDGMVFLQGYLFRKEEINKEEEMKRLQRLERYGTVVETARGDKEKLEELKSNLKNSLGLEIKTNKAVPEIAAVTKSSPAYDAGIRKGDLLVAVWGKLTGYMPIGEILELALDKPSLELKCTIERTANVEIGDKGAFAGPERMIGASLKMEFDGLTISGVKDNGAAGKAGLEKDDLITAIDGKSTRYMPLQKAVELIKSSKEDSVKLTIRRELTIWRRK